MSTIVGILIGFVLGNFIYICFCDEIDSFVDNLVNRVRRLFKLPPL